MSNIEFSCPHCGRQMRAPAEYAARRAKCTSCGQNVMVPPETQREPAVTSHAKAPPKASSPPPARQQPEQELCVLRPSWKLLYDAIVKAVVASLALAVVIGVLRGSTGIGFLVFVASMFICGGLAVLSVWLNQLGNLLRITDKRCVLRQGILSRATSEVHHGDVRNIRVRQHFTDRLFNIGTLGISTAAQADVEITIKGVDDPYRIRDLIDSYHE
jgi:membrane protein YdbS with pleckstrin-like domain/DNA-directed RNA polymerase subunit RPC12/RpoP